MIHSTSTSSNSRSDRRSIDLYEEKKKNRKDTPGELAWTTSSSNSRSDRRSIDHYEEKDNNRKDKPGELAWT